MDFLCQQCNEAKATVHITEVMPEKREQHLCEACAVSEGIIIKQTSPTTSQILNEFIKHKSKSSAEDDRTCPRCGMTFREFRLKGQLGCPHDYEVFRPMLAPLIERAHSGAAHHIGKAPTAANDTAQQRADLVRLKRDLQTALDSEDYETAASLRDQISAIAAPETP